MVVVGAYGVLGYNDNDVAPAIGVHGISVSPTGFGGYFQGRGYFSGNVGIGTTEPVSKLHVDGTSVFAGRVGIGAIPTAPLEVAGTTLLRGDVGIGTYITIPECPLHVGGNSRFDGNENYFEGRIGIGVTNPAASLHIGGTAGQDGIMFPDGSLQTTAFDSPWTPAVDGIHYTGGKVGIGTSHPGSKLHVLDATQAVIGTATSGTIGAVGVVGQASATDETAAGVRGVAASLSNVDNDAVGVHGISYSNGVGFSAGVKGEGPYGVVARATYVALSARAAPPSPNNAYGITTRVFGDGGVAAISANGTLSSPGCLAGSFVGDVGISGTLVKGGGAFKIDHPLDPENKYLYHSFVESPDMMNIYNGNVITDSSGEVWVSLPDWFSVLNKDFRYQLTVIGEFAQAIIADKIQDNRFRIRTDKPSIEVSWQVTGIRQDRWAEANRIPVEEQKPIGKRPQQP